ncbi:MAG: ArsR family transcriptional regulator [Planctomycetota bacterium]|nr:MAG: ArsR family transcriptional regulator [Planctomycetota bacterium]
MSTASHERAARSLRGKAPLFAALGDATRLAILTKLTGGAPLSITRLTAGTALTRQAVTKHLRVLQATGLVRSVRRGRENRFALRPEPLEEARRALTRISRQWDEALARLKSLVEE